MGRLPAVTIMLMVFGSTAHGADETSSKLPDGMVIAQHNDTVTSILIRSYIAANHKNIKTFKISNNIVSDELTVGDVFKLPGVTKTTANNTPPDTATSPRIVASGSDNKTRRLISKTLNTVDRPMHSGLTSLTSPAEVNNSDRGFTLKRRRIRSNFMASRYLDRSGVSKHWLVTDLDHQPNTIGFDLQTELTLDSDLSGTRATSSSYAEMNGAMAIAVQKHSTLETRIKYLFNHTTDQHWLNATGIEFTLPNEGYPAIFSVQRNARTWNILEEYSSTATSVAPTYYTVKKGVDLFIDPYYGLGIQSESGTDNGNAFSITTLTGWKYLSDNLYLEVSKTNQPEYYDFSTSLNYQISSTQTADLRFDFGRAMNSAYLTYRAQNAFNNNADIELTGILDYTNSLDSEIAATISKAF